MVSPGNDTDVRPEPAEQAICDYCDRFCQGQLDPCPVPPVPAFTEPAERCMSRDPSSGPSWMSAAQAAVDACYCDRRRGHDGDHACEHGEVWHNSTPPVRAHNVPLTAETRCTACGARAFAHPLVPRLGECCFRRDDGTLVNPWPAT